MGGLACTRVSHILWVVKSNTIILQHHPEVCHRAWWLMVHWVWSSPQWRNRWFFIIVPGIELTKTYSHSNWQLWELGSALHHPSLRLKASRSFRRSSWVMEAVVAVFVAQTLMGSIRPSSILLWGTTKPSSLTRQSIQVTLRVATGQPKLGLQPAGQMGWRLIMTRIRTNWYWFVWVLWSTSH
jgi:hypothetical protein